MAFRTATRFLASGYDVGGPGDEFAYIPAEVIGQARNSLISARYVVEVPDDKAMDKKFYEERGYPEMPENNPQDSAPAVVPLPYETHSHVAPDLVPEDERTEGERVLDPASAAAGGFQIVADPAVQHTDEKIAAAQAGEEVPQGEEVQKSDQSENDEVDATPEARKLAEEGDVDLSRIEGTGSDGKVTKPDVEKHLEA